MRKRIFPVALLASAAVGMACHAAPTALGPASSIAVVSAESTFVLGDSLLFRARHDVVGRALRTSVTVRNLRAGRTQVSWSGCAVDLRLYRGAAREGAAEFDWLDRPNPDPADGGAFWGCPLVLVRIDLAPGSAEIRFGEPLDVPIARILADSLRAGRMFTTTRISVSGAELRIPTGVLELGR